MAGLFAWAFLLGLAFCAPPGAVTAEALRRGLRGGFRAALLIELGSLVGDAVWAALALAGAALLVQHPVVRLLLGAAGVGLLLRLAWHAWRDAQRLHLPSGAAHAGGHFTTGAVLSLANPLAVAFWLGVGGAVTAAVATEPRPADFAVFFAGFVSAALLYGVAFAALVAWGRRLVTVAWFRWVSRLCSVALAYLACSLFWSTFVAAG